MKMIRIRFLQILVLILPCTIQAQDPISIPLSQPGEPGTLHVNVVIGSISVSAHSGDDVLLSYSSSGEGRGGIGSVIGDVLTGIFDQDNSDTTDRNREGLTRIPNSNFGIEVTERSNVVNINAPPFGNNTHLEIQVPNNFSLNLSSVDGGDIIVNGITGKHEVSNVNGGISMTNIGGSAVLNTVNGDIHVQFSGVSENVPMSFTTLNGDIELTVPESAGFNVKVRSEWGEIYSDFDVALNRSGINRESSEDSDTYKVSIDQWVTGSINGGGPEYVFRTLGGDIIIRGN